MKKSIKISLWILISVFIFINLVAIFHSYKFTHFSETSKLTAGTPIHLSTSQKIRSIVFGIDIARPSNNSLPDKNYSTIRLKSNKEIECWLINVPESKGTVIMFHGYGGNKSNLLEKSTLLNDLGYSTFLVDFMGSGGSEGNQTTIGFKEAQQVKTCYDYMSSMNEKNIYLFGTSMGAVAIMKCIHDYEINPTGIILECPFGTMYQTVCARFKLMKVPYFPMAGLLVFWGGIQNGFWGFDHNPETYAKKIKCNTLLMYGAKDDRVTRSEIDNIYKNIPAKKELKVYEQAGHSNYLVRYKNEWKEDVENFLEIKEEVSISKINRKS